jgi:DNA polymerase I-like protein with 3'-5' exonuclease and polymerase domains
MKKAAIIARNEIYRRGLDGFFVGNIHDEGQLDCAPRDAQEIGKVCVHAIEEAGRALGFKVPLTGAYKEGANWSETH